MSLKKLFLVACFCSKALCSCSTVTARVSIFEVMDFMSLTKACKVAVTIKSHPIT